MSRFHRQLPAGCNQITERGTTEHKPDDGQSHNAIAPHDGGHARMATASTSCRRARRQDGSARLLARSTIPLTLRGMESLATINRRAHTQWSNYIGSI